jgi:hypothetical protein
LRSHFLKGSAEELKRKLEMCVPISRRELCLAFVLKEKAMWAKSAMKEPSHWPEIE